jgi:hypothetical protein
LGRSSSCCRFDCGVECLLLRVVGDLVDCVEEVEVRLGHALQVVEVEGGEGGSSFRFCVSGFAASDGDGIEGCCLENAASLTGLKGGGKREGEGAKGKDRESLEMHDVVGECSRSVGDSAAVYK